MHQAPTSQSTTYFCYLAGTSTKDLFFRAWLKCVILQVQPEDYYTNNATTRQIIDQINNGYFNPDQPALFRDIYNSIVHHER
ncbi:hypothetical protein DPMN_175095 [Dreissena polymorpha]|uniref:Uncharacterized protein n=1 Tax=Dreissena polymorpha TaxID=45954 RepID=A0A9D4E4K8_DREPO|nr:hypothetical protein DPMN_175095 [Dreissena polymorpha]